MMEAAAMAKKYIDSFGRERETYGAERSGIPESERNEEAVSRNDTAGMRDAEPAGNGESKSSI